MSDTPRRILVVVAHPDDELLGVGGTLLKHRRAGDVLTILILGDGEESRNTGVDVPARQLMAEVVSKTLGATLILEQFRDNEFDTHSLLSITKVVERVVEQSKPQTIYTHHLGDLNIDHRLTAEAVLTAVRPMPGNQIEEILLFETVSSTEWQFPRSEYAFLPTVYVNIEEELEVKLALLKHYDREMRPWPHARSYEAITTLAKKRGAEVGYEAAEAFMLARQLRP
ncbi:MAG: PIG-L family deacetylase [Candidatus Pacebacteria bacterium]|nr:PIG-L family deacetylase [Candidatus Paceibacterota bacterium]MBP9842565.1 PIG-L family deacetylase [Candidatus Paceibacterota bacterium]